MFAVPCKAPVRDAVFLVHVMPPILISVMPSASRTYANLKKTGEGLTMRQLGNLAAVRGALALTLRSITSTEEHLNYLTGSTISHLKVISVQSAKKLRVFSVEWLDVTVLQMDAAVLRLPGESRADRRFFAAGSGHANHLCTDRCIQLEERRERIRHDGTDGKALAVQGAFPSVRTMPGDRRTRSPAME